MKKTRALLMTIVLAIVGAFSGVPIGVSAATYDPVTVNFVYEIRDVRGKLVSQRSASSTSSTSVDPSRYQQVCINVPETPAGYSFSDVHMENQSGARDGSFVYARFIENKTKIALEFEGHYEQHEDEENRRGSSDRTITLFITCTPNQYQVTYDYNGGSGDTMGKQITYNEKYDTLPNGKREGSTFIGWSLDIGGTQMVYADTVVTTAANHVLYAQWGNSSYKVTLDGNGGVSEQAYVNVSYGSKYILPIATREGYSFAGWFTAPQGGALVSDSTICTRAEEHTLYAHWTNNSFPISFDGNGGISKSGSKQVTYQGTYGTLPEATRTGYTFVGWFTEKEQGTNITASSQVTITGAHTLYAHWSANGYTVNFDADGGECKTDKQNYIYGDAYKTLPEATRTGYTFAGWYLGNQLITNESICYVSETSTFKAHWTANSYEITFDPNDGVCNKKYKTVTYDDVYGELPISTRTGYTFAGWYLRGQLVDAESAVLIVQDEDLVAHWLANRYEITFNANGGDCDAKKWGYYYDDYYANFPIPEKEGFTFLGWFTKKDGGVQIKEKMKVNVLSDFILYAHWEKLPEDPDSDDGILEDGGMAEDGGKIRRDMTVEEAATHFGYSQKQIRTIMNIYQVKAQVAGQLLRDAENLGATYDLVTQDISFYENKKSGNDLTGSNYLQMKAKLSKVTESSISLSWKEVKGAKKYSIYYSECGKDKFELLTTTSAKSCTKRNLKKGTYYRFFVVAYANISGKSVPIAISANVHGVTKGGDYSNIDQFTLQEKKTIQKSKKDPKTGKVIKSKKKVKKIEVKKKTIKKKKSFKIYIKASYKDKKHHEHRGFRFISSNPKVATVNKSGKVTAKSKGKCTIYCYDQSGKCRTVKITVK